MLARVRPLLARIAIQRELRAAANNSGGATMRGRLSQLNLVDLLQALELGGKTCRLMLQNADLECELYMERGAVVHASCGTQSGEEAVFAALTWASATRSLLCASSISCCAIRPCLCFATSDKRV